MANEKKNVLIVVDMQNDFISGSLGTKEALSIVENVVREINDTAYTDVFYTMDTHEYSNGVDYLETLEGKNLPVKHCIFNTEGFKLEPRIKKALDKRGAWAKHKFTFGYNWFDDEDINNIKPDSITVCGLCTNVCVVSNALILRATFPNIPIYYVEDGCAGTSAKKHDAACQIMESCQIYKKEGKTTNAH